MGLWHLKPLVKIWRLETQTKRIVKAKRFVKTKRIGKVTTQKSKYQRGSVILQCFDGVVDSALLLSRNKTSDVIS
jgi:hypothetical protein